MESGHFKLVVPSDADGDVLGCKPGQEQGASTGRLVEEADAAAHRSLEEMGQAEAGAAEVEAARALSEAANRIGHSHRHVVVETEGPEELRRLARAFNEMQDRIAELVESRTRSLLAVSHDLRTPLARMRLRLDGREHPGDREELAADVAEMSAMLDTLLDWLAGTGPGDPVLRAEAVRRFQQLSAPIAAKAVEDTAFYRYGRLLSLNDVGSDADRFGLSPDGFLQSIETRAEAFPDAMLTGGTHDHKRGEDSRARLAVLSELPELAPGAWVVDLWNVSGGGRIVYQVGAADPS